MLLLLEKIEVYLNITALSSQSLCLTLRDFPARCFVISDNSAVKEAQNCEKQREGDWNEIL